jgi:hypothetical protein
MKKRGDIQKEIIILLMRMGDKNNSPPILRTS